MLCSQETTSEALLPAEKAKQGPLARAGPHTLTLSGIE
jgi:hypothetical protein